MYLDRVYNMSEATLIQVVEPTYPVHADTKIHSPDTMAAEKLDWDSALGFAVMRRRNGFAIFVAPLVMAIEKRFDLRFALIIVICYLQGLLCHMW